VKIDPARAAFVDQNGPGDPVELSYVLGTIIAAYVKRHGNKPETQIAVLGAIEAARAEVYFRPGNFGATN
jgi:hypothetical protein